MYLFLLLFVICFKVLVGVKFLPKWPFVGRLRVCFLEPPYFQMTVKPIFAHGLDVTELPGIAGWLVSILHGLEIIYFLPKSEFTLFFYLIRISFSHLRSKRHLLR